jgi:hypothetical protein
MRPHSKAHNELKHMAGKDFRAKKRVSGFLKVSRFT